MESTTNTRQSSISMDLEALKAPNDKQSTIHNTEFDGSGNSDRDENRLALVTSNEGPNVSMNTEDVPEGGYGWVVLAALFAVNVCTWGIISVSQFQRVKISGTVL